MTSPAPHPRAGRRPDTKAPTQAVAPTIAGTGPTVGTGPTADAAARARTLTFGTVAWLVVLAAVAGVQLNRHAWADSVVLFVVLAVLVTDLTGRLRHGTVAVAATGPAIIGAAVLVGLVLFVAPRHGTVAGLAVVAAGAAAVAYAWPDRADDEAMVDDRPVWDRPTSRTALAWSAAWVAGCLWELAMFLLGGTESDGRDVYPAASDLLDPILANPLAKALFVVVWLSVGVSLLARTDRR